MALVGCSSTSSTAESSIPSTDHRSAPTDTSAPTPPVAPVGFRSITITVTRADGSTEEHCVWLADDEPSQERGLMGITDTALGGRSGMLFSFPTDTSVAFWMKDTPMPLSIVWFDGTGSFVSSTDMQPCPAGTRSCPTYRAAGPYRTALEVPLGRDRDLGLVVGSGLRLGGSCDSPGL